MSCVILQDCFYSENFALSLESFLSSAFAFFHIQLSFFLSLISLSTQLVLALKEAESKNTTNSLLFFEHRASKRIIQNRFYHFLRRSSVPCNLTKKVIKSIQMSVSPSKFWTLIYLRLRNATDPCFRDYYYYGKNKEKRTRFSDSCRNISV